MGFQWRLSWDTINSSDASHLEKHSYVPSCCSKVPACGIINYAFLIRSGISHNHAAGLQFFKSLAQPFTELALPPNKLVPLFRLAAKSAFWLHEKHKSIFWADASQSFRRQACDSVFPSKRVFISVLSGLKLFTDRAREQLLFAESTTSRCFANRPISSGRTRYNKSTLQPDVRKNRHFKHWRYSLIFHFFFSQSHWKKRYWCNIWFQLVCV